jgi:hypothetical protein
LINKLAKKVSEQLLAFFFGFCCLHLQPFNVSRETLLAVNHHINILLTKAVMKLISRLANQIGIEPEIKK